MNAYNRIFICVLFVLCLSAGMIYTDRQIYQLRGQVNELQEQVQELQPRESEEIYKADVKIALQCIENNDHGRLIRYCQVNNLSYEALMAKLVAEGYLHKGEVPADG